MRLYNWLSASVQQLLEPRRNTRGGSRCSSSDERERALISCAGCDLGLPCTVPQGYCRAFTILFPIFTSSVLPTTANGKWLCGAEGEETLVYGQTHLRAVRIILKFLPKNNHVLYFITEKSKSITAIFPAHMEVSGLNFHTAKYLKLSVNITQKTENKVSFLFMKHDN